MSKEIKQKWIDALKSGNYLQGVERLKKLDEDTQEIHYCCLGVLCEICEKESDKAPTDVKENTYCFHFENTSPRTQYPPVTFLKKTFDMRLSRSEYLVGRLATMNDDEEASFENIADWIEENL